MSTISSATTSTINVPLNREQTPVRDEPLRQAKVDTAKQAEAETQKSFNSQQQTIVTQKIEPSIALQGGNRRGSLLDLSV